MTVVKSDVISPELLRLPLDVDARAKTLARQFEEGELKPAEFAMRGTSYAFRFLPPKKDLEVMEKPPKNGRRRLSWVLQPLMKYLRSKAVAALMAHDKTSAGSWDYYIFAEPDKAHHEFRVLSVNPALRLAKNGEGIVAPVDLLRRIESAPCWHILFSEDQDDSSGGPKVDREGFSTTQWTRLVPDLSEAGDPLDLARLFCDREVQIHLNDRRQRELDAGDSGWDWYEPLWTDNDSILGGLSKYRKALEAKAPPITPQDYPPSVHSGYLDPNALKSYLSWVVHLCGGAPHSVFAVPAWYSESENDLDEMPNGALVIVFRIAPTAAELELIATTFRLGCSFFYAAEQVRRQVVKHSLRSAVANVLAGSMAHNLGSHMATNAAARYRDASRKTKKYGDIIEEAAAVIEFLRERMVWVGHASHLVPIASMPLYLYRDVIGRFFHQNPEEKKVADRRQTKLPEMLLEDLKVNAVTPHIQRWNAELVGEHRDRYVKLSRPRALENDDEIVAVPGGRLGVHAYCVILENVLRNAAKYGVRTSNGQLPLRMALGRQLHDHSSESELVELFIWDDWSVPSADLVEAWNGNTKPAWDAWDRVNMFCAASARDPEFRNPTEAGEARDHSHIVDPETGQTGLGGGGIREMRVAAAWLRGLDLNDVLEHSNKLKEPLLKPCLFFSGAEDDVKVYEGLGAALRALPAEGDRKKLCIGYRVCIPRACILAIAGKDSSLLKPMNSAGSGVAYFESIQEVAGSYGRDASCLVVLDATKPDLDYIRDNRFDLPMRLLVSPDDEQLLESVKQISLAVALPRNGLSVDDLHPESAPGTISRLLHHWRNAVFVWKPVCLHAPELTNISCDPPDRTPEHLPKDLRISCPKDKALLTTHYVYDHHHCLPKDCSNGSEWVARATVLCTSGTYENFETESPMAPIVRELEYASMATTLAAAQIVEGAQPAVLVVDGRVRSDKEHECIALYSCREEPDDFDAMCSKAKTSHKSRPWLLILHFGYLEAEMGTGAKYTKRIAALIRQHPQISICAISSDRSPSVLSGLPYNALFVPAGPINYYFQNKARVPLVQYILNSRRLANVAITEDHSTRN